MHYKHTKNRPLNYQTENYITKKNKRREKQKTTQT